MAAADICKLKQLIHFYDYVNAIYSIKQCWCSFLSSVLVLDCLSGLGVLGAVQLCGVLSVNCWQRSSVRAICLQQHPGQWGLAAGAWAGPRHHHRHLRHLCQGDPVQSPGEVAAAEKKKMLCHVECDAMRLTSHTTIRKLKQVADTFQPCHY